VKHNWLAARKLSAITLALREIAQLRFGNLQIAVNKSVF
jgi:hypothetical protein